MKKKKILIVIGVILVLFIVAIIPRKKFLKTNIYVYNGIYHWDNNDSNNKTKHTFVNDVCTECGLYYNKTFFDIFGDEAIMYKSNNNPYGVDIEKYGDSINVYFYTPNFDLNKDKYINVDKNNFYNDNYNISMTYEDSFYRSKHGLLSGKKGPLNYSPNCEPIKEGNDEIKLNDATYVLDKKGNFLGYFTNSLNNKSRPIWYCGAYVTHDDVAAYLLAFGKVPANSDYIPSKQEERRGSVDKWGEYARLNKTYFENDIKKFSYEPKLPGGRYIETDYGSTSEYFVGDIKQVPYIKGQKIVRGACRFVFIDIASKTKIDDRYVFYTSNHYNDFQEYLNYDGGYGKLFGNESAGNPYCNNLSEYSSSLKPSTQYKDTIKKNIKDVLVK